MWSPLPQRIEDTQGRTVFLGAGFACATLYQLTSFLVHPVDCQTSDSDVHQMRRPKEVADNPDVSCEPDEDDEPFSRSRQHHRQTLVTRDQGTRTSIGT